MDADSRREIDQAIAAFQSGADRDRSFAVIYRAYHPALVRFFLRKGLSREASCDLTQETLFRVWKTLDAYQHRDRFAGWLYTVAHTQFLKHLRARSTKKREGMKISPDEVRQSELAAGGRDALDQAIADERRDALLAAVRGLPEQMRACVLLRLYELSRKEIAAVLDRSPDTVKSHLARAMSRLRETLGNGGANALRLEADD